MLKSLVNIGGVLGLAVVLSCGGKHPALNLEPTPSYKYAGYKGGASRDGYFKSDEDIGLSPLWQIKFRYPLFYSPSMAGEYIFQPGTDKKIHVIEVNTGVEVAEIKVRRQPGAVPELADSFLVICEESEEGELLVINYISGELVWNVKTYGLCLQPAIYNNAVFWVDGRETINAARLTDGYRLWSEKLGAVFYAGPVICNDRLFIATAEGIAYCLDVENGEILWQDDEGSVMANSSPACYQDRLYYCSADGRVICYDSFDGEILWEHNEKPRLFYSPCVDESGLYYGTGDGLFVKLDRDSGEKIWEFSAQAPVRGAALVTPRTVIFTSLDYRVFMLDKENGELLSSYTTSGMISAAPALYRDKLFIAAQDKFLYCFSTAPARSPTTPGEKK